MRVEIGTVHTSLEVQEPMGSLSAEDVRKLMRMMSERFEDERWLAARLREDRQIRNRSYLPDSERHEG